MQKTRLSFDKRVWWWFLYLFFQDRRLYGKNIRPKHSRSFM